MGDFKIASPLPSESYYNSDGSTESVTFPRVGDEVLGKRRIVVHCNQRTSVPKIDHPLQPEQPADPATSSSGSFDPTTIKSGNFEVGTLGSFEEALAEFETSELAQGLEEEVRNEYFVLCKRGKCLPHKGERALYLVTEGIQLMVDVVRRLKKIDVEKEDATSIQHDLLLLFLEKMYGFKCEYLNLVLGVLLSAQESYKDCEKKEGELRAEMAKVQERRKVIDLRWRKFQGSI